MTAPTPGSDAPSIGSRLLDRRRELGLRQVDLADRSGVQQATISRIERGAVVPTLAILNRLRVALAIEDEEYLELLAVAS